MNKYIPSPWIAYDNGNGMRVCPADVQDALIPHVAAIHSQICHLKAPNMPSGEQWDLAWEQVKSNAYLISTAPEMFSLLNSILEMAGNGSIDLPTGTIDQIETVLNKATGGK